MDKIKWTEAMLADIDVMRAIHQLVDDYFVKTFSQLVFASRTVVKGLTIEATPTASGQVIVKQGSAIGNEDGIIVAEADQTANILSGSGSTLPPPVLSWGNGQAAHASNIRKDIVGIKFADYEAQPEATWFIDDTSSPPVKFQQTVNKRTLDYFEIAVFHGPDDGSSIDPIVPVDYISLARITVPAGVSTITNNDIEVLFTALDIGQNILGLLQTHIHDNIDGTQKIDYNDLLNLPTITPGALNHTDLLDIIGDPTNVNGHDVRYDPRYGGTGWNQVATLRKLAEAIISNSDALTESDIGVATKFHAYYAP